MKAKKRERKKNQTLGNISQRRRNKKERVKEKRK